MLLLEIHLGCPWVNLRINMEIMIHLINGMALGIEYVPEVDPDEPEVRCVVLDLLIVRFMCFF